MAEPPSGTITLLFSDIEGSTLLLRRLGDGYAELLARHRKLLRQAFARNSHMKVFMAKGYYDMATPFFAADYTISHLGLDPSVQKNITTAEYDAGHMMYIREESLKILRKDIAAFYDSTLK